MRWGQLELQRTNILPILEETQISSTGHQKSISPSVQRFQNALQMSIWIHLAQPPLRPETRTPVAGWWGQTSLEADLTRKAIAGCMTNCQEQTCQLLNNAIDQTRDRHQTLTTCILHSLSIRTCCSFLQEQFPFGTTPATHASLRRCGHHPSFRVGS